jgi:hypothetical protein
MSLQYNTETVLQICTKLYFILTNRSTLNTIKHGLNGAPGLYDSMLLFLVPTTEIKTDAKLPLINGNHLISNETQREKTNLKGYMPVSFSRRNSVSY